MRDHVVMTEMIDRIAEGRVALEAADWLAARAAFEEALAVDPSAEALDGFGLAVWFLGDLRAGVEYRERSFEAYVREGNCDRAARIAVWIANQYMISGRASAAGGWLARAERTIEGTATGAGHGWVAVEQARRATSVEESAARARDALEIARLHGDDDLEAFALSVLGRAEVNAGRLQEGSRNLEEAMAAASAGRVRSVHTLGEAYCNLILASSAAGDWEKTSEWCQYVDAFARERGITILFGVCRTVHADTLVAHGRWDDAEAALEDAIAAHQRSYPAVAAPSVSALALLRVKQGRLAEAEQLLEGREEHPSSLLALAELRLAEGEPRVAAALLERGLSAVGDDVMAEVKLLAPLVDALLSAGEIERASSVVQRLEDLGADQRRRLVRAHAELAAARVAHAEDRNDEAQEHARVALEQFGALGMPHEAAEARLELAQAHSGELPALAEEEARASLAVFRQLGSARGMDAAAAVLRELGVGTGAGPRTHGDLTARELEVLSLVARGMTNARIAETLFISEKTAGHHVSRILSKLGVRNRAEAATYASRLGVGIE